MRLLHPIALIALALLTAARAMAFTHFEARQTHAIALTPDGTRLLALHSPDARLAVFDVSNPSTAPALLAEILVGLGPVAVRARTNDEAWVVSEVSDSISIVSLSRRAVIATLAAPDEPADVVFAQGRAFVTCARSNLVRVFDTTTRAELAPIALEGLYPQSLATDGVKVFVASLHSGNGTTILPKEAAPAQPAPTNTALPAAPDTALIVAANDSRVRHVTLDRDVAEIDAATLAVTRNFGGAGTNLLDLAVHPLTGDVWVANTEALNLTRFEPALRGHFVDHRLTRLAASDGAATVFDLNPGLDYAQLPNAAAQATALAQPTALVFTADGSAAWVAAFASDRVAKVATATGEVLARIDVRTGGGDAGVMRGPRSLALHPAQPRLFVLNKLADTVSVIDTDTNSVFAEVAIASRDTMPAPLREGRGFLFDARVSGNGTASCAACHLDADRDGLAWDLGDPSGEMTAVTGRNLSVHDNTPRQRTMHPMKGPMVTQTLRGLKDGAPFHWRGDRATLQDFNPTFDRLMGGAQIDAADMDALAAYLGSLRHHPNPNRTRDGALPPTLDGANPVRGEALFTAHNNHCAVCHALPTGTNHNIDLAQEVGAAQPVKTPPLATTYQRLFYDPRTGARSRSGFGLNHDGTGFVLPTVHPYVLDTLSTAADFADVAAFVLCIDTGTAPIVGSTVTIDASTTGFDDLARLETESIDGTCDLVAEGVVGGVRRSFIFSRTLQRYVTDVFGEAPLTRAELLALLAGDDALTFLGAPPLEGARFGGSLDRRAVLASDSYFTRSKTAPLAIAATRGVLANDTRVTLLTDTLEQSFAPALGSVALAADGAFTYTPGAGFVDLDHFTYRVLIAGDAGNATDDAEVTISTMASAAARYSGHVKASATEPVAGFVNVNVTRTGAWSGVARLGLRRQPLRGRMETNGELRIVGRPALTVALQLSARADGTRSVGAFVRDDTAFFTGTLARSPYSPLSPAPNAGRRVLTLALTSSTGAAPNGGRAVLTLTARGVAKLTGRLGETTRFSASAVVGPRDGGGWVLPVFARFPGTPAGTIGGVLAFDPALSTGIAGPLTAVQPPQTRPVSPGFTAEFATTEIQP